MAAELRIQQRPLSPERIQIAVSGELDLATVPQLDERLRALQAPGQVIVIDLRELSFIDSTGISVLLAHSQASQRDGWQLLVGQPLPECAERVFALAGIDKVLSFTPISVP